MRDSSAASTLAAAAWPVKEGSLGILRPVTLVLAGIVLISLSARIQVPMWPVPMTMQTFAALMVGMAYGWRLGGVTLLSYLGAGAMGFPVFASGAGLAYFAGPTGGYLVGFLVAAVLVGWLAERGWDQGFLRTALAMAGGTAMIFLFGVAWLAVFLGDVDKALVNGLYPFVFGGVVKVVLAALLMPFCWKILDRFSR